MSQCKTTTYKLLFAVYDHCEFAEVTVSTTNDTPCDPEGTHPNVSVDDTWAIPLAQFGLEAACRRFRINPGSLYVQALRVTPSDSTPDNIAVAAFIAVGLHADVVEDSNKYIDHFIRDRRIRFPSSDGMLAEWLQNSN